MEVIMTSIRLYNKQNNEYHEHSLPPITYPTPLYPLELPDRAHSHSPAAQQTVRIPNFSLPFQSNKFIQVLVCTLK